MIEVYEIATGRRRCVTGSEKMAMEFAGALRARGLGALVVRRGAR